MKTIWEYLEFKDDLFHWEALMEKVGADGWELVAVIPDSRDGDNRCRFFFKRPKEDAPHG